MIDVKGARLKQFNAKGSMGIIKDTRYINCFWPASDVPFSPFAKGSSGIEVQGPPTPRNIIFPEGTVFLNGTRGDCFYRAEYVDTLVDRPSGEIIKAKAVIDGKEQDVAYMQMTQATEKIKIVTELTEAEARK